MGMSYEYDGGSFKLSGLLLQAVAKAGIDYDQGICVLDVENQQAMVIHELVALVNHDKVLDYENLYQDALQLRKAMLFIALALENLNGKREEIVFA
jgi:hypothetical protein